MPVFRKLDCLDNSDCATGASCDAGVCSCNTGTPVLVGDSASDTSDECVECTSTDFGSCAEFDSCDTSTNLCVGKNNYFFCFLFSFFILIISICMYAYFCCISDCLSTSECASGAVCSGSLECACASTTPVLIGASASDVDSTCVECTGADFGSCDTYDSCDEINNVCVGM